MSVYQLSIFLHVVAALALFGAMTVEWLIQARLHAATSVRQVRLRYKACARSGFLTVRRC